MFELKNFFYARGIKKTSDEEIIGLPIPLIGEMAIIDYKDLDEIDLNYKGKLTVPIWRIKQASFKFLNEKEMLDFIRRFKNA